MAFYKDIPWVLATGGSKGELAIWDIEESETISKHFTPFLDKSKVPDESVLDDDEEEADMGEDESDEEQEKKKQAKKTKKENQIKQLNKIS